jgi:hypothetical protein
MRAFNIDVPCRGVETSTVGTASTEHGESQRLLGSRPR